MVQKFVYIHGIARISLLSRKKYISVVENLLLKKMQHYFRLNRHLNQTQLDSTKPNKSPTWRLVQSPTSTASLQKTVLHPCNSSSCPQGRRSTEVAHSFSFSIVTPLVNMSAGFLDPQIFSSIISLSSTR